MPIRSARRWVPGSSAVFAQAAVDGKSNEITAFAPPLEPLDLTGTVITADAMRTQREQARFLVSDKKAHYILVVKKNQPGLYAQVKNLPWPHIPAGHRQRGRGHGREERRTLQAPPSPPGSPSPTPSRPSTTSATSPTAKTPPKVRTGNGPR
jgi:predicted transposase YbfD/YdcC